MHVASKDCHFSLSYVAAQICLLFVPYNRWQSVTSHPLLSMLPSYPLDFLEQAYPYKVSGLCYKDLVIELLV